MLAGSDRDTDSRGSGRDTDSRGSKEILTAVAVKRGDVSWQ